MILAGGILWIILSAHVSLANPVVRATNKNETESEVIYENLEQLTDPIMHDYTFKNSHKRGRNRKACECRKLRQRIKELEDKLERIVSATEHTTRTAKPAIVLPKCHAGQYITSDGTNLFCVKYNTPGTLGGLTTTDLPTKKVTDLNTVPQFNGGAVRQLYANTWALHSFRWNGHTYLGTSQQLQDQNDKSKHTFFLFKWMGNAFVQRASVYIPISRAWTSFTWQNKMFLVITSNDVHKKGVNAYARIYSLDLFDQLTLVKNIKMQNSFSVSVLKHEGHIYVALLALYGQHSFIYTYKSGEFVEHSKIGISGQSVEAFHIDGRAFLATVGYSSKNEKVYIYELSDHMFRPFLEYVTTSRPNGVTYVRANNQHFLAVAESRKKTTPMRGMSLLLRWNGKTFVKHQEIESCRLSKFATTTIRSKEGVDITYLAATNYDCDPVLYVYDPVSEFFKKTQEINSKWTRAMEFFKTTDDHGGPTYLAVGSTQKVTFYATDKT